MTASALDPLIHDPPRLRVVATLAALPPGDALSVTRLRDMTRLPAGSLVTRLRELDHAGYVRTDETGGSGELVAVALTKHGRSALDRYNAVLRGMSGDYDAPAPELRVGDADRDMAAAALGEHFALGRLTLDELTTRLAATLTATTHGELSQAARDLPQLPARAARFSGRRRKPRATRGS
jgi:DNA-binding MarR family transcriptional regulator